MGKVSYLQNGETTIDGISRASLGEFPSDGVIGDDDLLVEEQGTPDNTVQIATGQILVGFDAPLDGREVEYYLGYVESPESVTITANASGNDRIDAIVAYVDVTAYGSTDNDGALKFASVDGTPAATPVAPTTAEVQAALGAGVPWCFLALVDAANGFTTITDSEITSARPLAHTVDRQVQEYETDIVVTGLTVSQDSGLDGLVSVGRAFVNGKLRNKPIEIAHTFSASKDTYVDMPDDVKQTGDDDLTYTEVSNGAASPALASNAIRLAKVVTDGSGITSVTTSGSDSLNNPIRPTRQSTGALYRLQRFSANGTFYTPANAKSIRVICIGGGGGGGAATSDETVGGGGSGGAYSERRLSISQITTTVAVTVGAAGAAGSGGAGGSGGTSSFGAYLSTTGGAGGALNGGSTATPGTGTGGDVNFTGGNGGRGGDNAYSALGIGGGSAYNSGGPHGARGAVGANGKTPGAGGGGGHRATVTSRNGGEGEGGVVLVYIYN